jgi:hypothetical protein
MPTKENTTSIQTTARLTGFLYLLLIPLGVFGLLYVPSTLIVSGDAAATASNIMANEGLFRLGSLSALVVALVNLFVVLLLYKLLKPVNRNVAALMVIFLLLSIPISFINELNNFAAPLLLGGADYLSVFTQAQLHALVLFFHELHQHGVIVAQVFWGLWLFPMGYLVFRSGYLPRIIGIFLMIGTFGYVVDSLTFMVFPNFGFEFAPFLFVGEGLLPLWLLIRGVDVKRWEQRALESASSPSTLRREDR